MLAAHPSQVTSPSGGRIPAAAMPKVAIASVKPGPCYRLPAAPILAKSSGRITALRSTWALRPGSLSRTIAY